MRIAGDHPEFFRKIMDADLSPAGTEEDKASPADDEEQQDDPDDT
jgi:hypothetical protein